MQTAIKQVPVTRDTTPKALKVTQHARHMASLEGLDWSFKNTVKRALQLMDTGEVVQAKLAGYFVGQTRQQIKLLLLPLVAEYKGCAFRTAESSGKPMLIHSHEAYEKTKKALERLVDVIVGEQNAHSEALEATEGEETSEGESKPAEVIEEPSEALIAAVAMLIQQSGVGKKTMSKAVTKAFASLK